MEMGLGEGHSVAGKGGAASVSLSRVTSNRTKLPEEKKGAPACAKSLTYGSASKKAHTGKKRLLVRQLLSRVLGGRNRRKRAVAGINRWEREETSWKKDRSYQVLTLTGNFSLVRSPV